ncbi:MarR family transcriptional regulator [Brevibacillus ruminantium]|uniref:MarR family transcriptional regulator n=1 Tax=Brevibacillus ruminantium TaxID=2950604 RepID=A0ABY4WIJ3_9BACL|nr:MarR family transcriptional regulator [Brevibacillus ruminantium]USG66616.1 MarR family transcriptional regulator [Brevibacillus ruminantium]
MTDQDNVMHFVEYYVEFHRKISTEWHRRLDRIISGSQAMILKTLGMKGRQKVSTLAEMLRITPGAVTSLSDKLIVNGYATRIRDETDRRVVYLEITDQGREVMQKYRAESRAAVKQFFAGLSEEDIQHLTRIYEQVLQNLHHGNEGKCE